VSDCVSTVLIVEVSLVVLLEDGFDLVGVTFETGVDVRISVADEPTVYFDIAAILSVDDTSDVGTTTSAVDTIDAFESAVRLDFFGDGIFISGLKVDIAASVACSDPISNARIEIISSVRRRFVYLSVSSTGRRLDVGVSEAGSAGIAASNHGDKPAELVSLQVTI